MTGKRANGIRAFYYDGRTSHRHDVLLSVEDKIASIDGDAARQCPISQLRVSERGSRSLPKVTFPDGAVLEIQDRDAFRDLLRATGYHDSVVVRWQQSWRFTVLAGLAVAALLTVLVVHVLPHAAAYAAKAVPSSVERTIGRESLAFLDSRILSPSRLPRARQQAIAERFQALVPPGESLPEFSILFRSSRIGPNALALPSGQIVLTDELVQLAPDDDALMGVLAHELGHLQERHLMRRLLQASAVAAGAFAIFGDASAVLANVSTVLLNLKYSRDAEHEADAYALDMLQANGIRSDSLADMLERLQDSRYGEPPPYLSSHPPSRDRIERIRQHQQGI